MRPFLVLCILLSTTPAVAGLDAHWRENMGTYWAQKASDAYAAGAMEPALAAYDSCLVYQPRQAAAWFNRGLVLEKLGRPAAALASYESTIVCDATLIPPRLNGSSLLYEQNRLSEALAWNDQAIQRAPDNAQVWFARGRILAGLERWAEVIACHTMALTYGLNSAEAMFFRGQAFVQLDAYEAALGSFRQADHVSPRNPSIWLNIAMTEYLADNNEGAIVAADSALSCPAVLPTARYVRAQSLVNLERFDEAFGSLVPAFDDTSADWPLREKAVQLLVYLTVHKKCR